MSFNVKILGCGSALPTTYRNATAQVVTHNGQMYLVDCAEATQVVMRRHGVRFGGLNHIFISHLHGDHFFGLPGMLSTMHLCGRTEPMTIVAPAGAREVVETTFRLTGNHVDYPIEWREMDFTEGEQRVFENRYCTVDAFPIEHSVPTYGFRITERLKSQFVPQPGYDGPIPAPRAPYTYAYCCDTVYTEDIVPHVEGVDLLCLESTFANELAEIATQRQHLTAGQAGRLACQAHVGKLLLTHISARYKEPEIILQQATEEFADTLLAEDGMRIEIKR